MISIQEHGDGVSLKIKVQPKASKNQVAGIIEDALKIRLTAPPVDGAANKACIEFVAELLGVAKSQVEILSGHTGRSKVVKVYGLSREQVTKKIMGQVD